MVTVVSNFECTDWAWLKSSCQMLKNIDLRKRKSISELFKCLNYCGLSYKRGIVNHFRLAFETHLKIITTRSWSQLAKVWWRFMNVNLWLFLHSHDYYLELFKSLAPCPALAWTQNQLYHLIRAAGEPCQVQIWNYLKLFEIISANS